MATLHDATARAKRDPVEFLMSVYDRLDDAHGIPTGDYFDSPQAVVPRRMDEVVRAELREAGIVPLMPPLPVRAS